MYIFCSFLELQAKAVPQRNFLAYRDFPNLIEDSDSMHDLGSEKCEVGGRRICS